MNAEVEVSTGEVMPTPTRMTPAEASAAARWVREMAVSVLTEGVDYGTLPRTDKPTLFKSGAEMLILAGGLRFTQQCRHDEEEAARQGVTYTCTVYRGRAPVAVCDGYAGRDESKWRDSPWNTLVKMAQKRALVGATLNATAASGLFIADVEDAPDRPAVIREPVVNTNLLATMLARAELLRTTNPEAATWLSREWQYLGAPSLRSSPRAVTRAHGELFRRMLIDAQQMPAGGPGDPHADVPVPAPTEVYDDAPEAAEHLGDDDPPRYDPADNEASWVAVDEEEL